MALIPTAPAATTSPDDYRRRIALALMQQGMDTAPVQAWTQGAARALQGALGGYEMYQDDQKQKQDLLDNLDAGYKAIYGDAKPAATSPTAAALAQPSATPAAPTAGKIYSNDEPSPLDPPSGIDRDQAIRTILAEAGNQGPTGMNAVGSVIRNRAVAGNYGGDTAGGVVTAPNQFEPWNTQGGRAKMGAIDPASPQYQAAAQALESAYAGNDPTNGAKNFIAPKVMEALGRPMPAWAQQPGQMIGDHKFIGGAPTEAQPAPYQVAGPPTASPVAAALAPQQPAAQPQADDPLRARIDALRASGKPSDLKMAAKLIDLAATQSLSPKYEFKTAGDTLYRTSASKGTAEPIKDVGRGVRPMSDDERAQWKVPDGMSAGIDDNGKPVFSPTGTNINLNTQQDALKKVQATAIEDMQGANAAGREATKRSGIWDSMEKASQGFTPGATADLKLSAARYLKDLGITTGEGVPDAEVFKQLQQQIAIHAQPKGQGAVSNVERELFAKAIPNITMSPEALKRSIDISRGLDNFDRKVANIYRENARKNGGVPNAVEINDEIDKLGSPLSVSDSTFLSKAANGDNAPAKSDLKKKYGLD